MPLLGSGAALCAVADLYRVDLRFPVSSFEQIAGMEMSSKRFLSSGLLPVAAMCVLALMSSVANAALILTIDNYTTDELSFTITGTFDADTVGAFPGYLAFKRDWSENYGVNTETFSALPTVTVNTIEIDSIALTFNVVSGLTFGDSFYIRNASTKDPFLAGTEVSGSVTLSAIGAFDPTIAATFELVSGWESPDWVRLEASATTASVSIPAPEPSTGILMGLGLLALGVRKRREI